VGRGCNGVPLPTEGWVFGGAVLPPQNSFGILYQNCELSCILGIAINYHLAVCFTRIGSTCGIEIYWRSFQPSGNYNYSFRKIARKNDKNAPKLLNIARKLFLYISIFIFLKLLRVVDWGGGMATPLHVAPYI